MRTKEVQQQTGQERGQLNKTQVKQVVLSESLRTETLMQHTVAKTTESDMAKMVIVLEESVQMVREGPEGCGGWPGMPRDLLPCWSL